MFTAIITSILAGLKEQIISYLNNRGGSRLILDKYDYFWYNVITSMIVMNGGS